MASQEVGGLAFPKVVSRKAWLSQIPNRWGIELVKRFFRFNPKSRLSTTEQVLSLTRKGIIERDISGNEGQIAESYENYPEVKEGDFVLNPMDLIAGWVARSKVSGKVSSAYYTFHLGETERGYAPFFELVFQTYYRERIFDPFGSGLGRMESGGGRWTLGRDLFMNFPIPVPPMEEQKAAVNYVIRETTQIDLLISKKEQLIEKLFERRQALITKLVSLGLDSSAPTKESGVEWAPAVPEKWPIKKLKYAFRGIKGGVWGEDAKGDELDIWCVRIADFDRRNFSIRTDSKTFRNVKLSERHGRILTQGDIVLEKSGGGEKAPVGFAAIYEHPEDAVCSNFTNIVTVDSGNFPKYWVYMLSAVYQSGAPWRSIKQTSGIQNLDISSYFDEEVPFPPLSIQIEIAESVNQGTENIDLLIDSTIRAIELLRERRQALITQVVTGKIDVRGFASGNS
jgi:type I restriction enzyme S subunit